MKIKIIDNIEILPLFEKLYPCVNNYSFGLEREDHIYTVTKEIEVSEFVLKMVIENKEILLLYKRKIDYISYNSKKKGFEITLYRDHFDSIPEDVKNQNDARWVEYRNYLNGYIRDKKINLKKLEKELRKSNNYYWLASLDRENHHPFALKDIYAGVQYVKSTGYKPK